MTETSDQDASESLPVGGAYRKLAMFLALAATMVAAWILARDYLQLAHLVEYQRSLADSVRESPVLIFGGAFLLYVIATGLSLPVGPVLKVLYGAVLGFLPAVILISFAATLGATLAFASSRYLIRDWVQRRFAARLVRVNAALEREGAFYLASLRLFPIAPFFVVNLVMGVTPMRVRTFWWVSWFAMLPITCVYVFAGASINLSKIAESGLTGLLTWPVITALTLLALAPLLLRWIWRKFRSAFAPAGNS